nr:MAG TPA: hypothetical protein [Caudoviricetes sp.]
MKKEIINEQLNTWFSQMLQKYTWLSIKFEYNDLEKCFMVSFSPKFIISQDEGFCKEALTFENEMNKVYGDYAPLFCDDEDLFTLSSEAEFLSNQTANSFCTDETIDFAKVNICNVSAYISSKEIEQNTDIKVAQYNNKYRIAA